MEVDLLLLCVVDEIGQMGIASVATVYCTYHHQSLVHQIILNKRTY